MADRLLTLAQVKDKVALGHTKIYGLIAEGRFPAPHKLGSISRWSEAEIEEWIEKFKTGQLAANDALDDAGKAA